MRDHGPAMMPDPDTSGAAPSPDRPRRTDGERPEATAFSREMGHVSRMEDLIALRDTGIIAGAISGRALYDGAIDLASALTALKG